MFSYFKSYSRVIVFLFLSSLVKPSLAGQIWHEKGGIYVRFNENIELKKQAELQQEDLPFLSDFFDKYVVIEIKSPFYFARYPGLEGIIKLKLADDLECNRAIEDLLSIKEVKIAERVPLKKTFSFTPNDTLYDATQQWNLFKIQASFAYNYIQSGNTPSVIAIVDDGMDYTHQDLSGNLWKNMAEVNGIPGFDDDHNFFVDDSIGFDLGNNDNDPMHNDTSWYHGTHVAGIAGAVTNNTTGIASIGYNCKLMAVKGSDSNLEMSNGYESIVYAADNGADIVNLSWGGPVYSAIEENVIYYARLLNCLVVAACGNSNNDSINYPAGYQYCLSVAGTNSNDVKTYISSYGPSIDVSAPAFDILSTLPGNRYGTLTGTSMASPLVAGLAGLMKSYNPLLTAQQIEDCIIQNTDPISFMNPNFTGMLGSGRINAWGAMACVSPTTHQLDAAINGIVNPSGYVCSNPVTPSVIIKNVGSDTLNSLTVKYKIDGGPVNSILWTGHMGYDSSQVISLPLFYAGSGVHTITVYCENPNGALDWSFVNDTVRSNFMIHNGGVNLPFSENFENGLNNQGWRIENVTDRGWTIRSGTINGQANKSAYINLFNNMISGDRDRLISPPLNFSAADSVFLKFDYAYQYNEWHPSDSLIIKASVDCGQNFIRIAAFAEDSLHPFATSNDSSNTFFQPTDSLKWCMGSGICMNIKMPASLLGVNGVSLVFETYNNMGNNLYIDNINVNGYYSPSSSPTGSISSSGQICAGQTINYSVNSTQAISSYNWTFQGGVPATANTQSVSVFYANAGTYTTSVQIANSLGNQTLNLSPSSIVNPFPSLSLNVSDTVLCYGDTLTLLASGASVYTWVSVPAGEFIQINSSQAIISPDENTLYYLVGASGAGCVSTVSFEVDTTICAGIQEMAVQKNLSAIYDSETNTLLVKNNGESGIFNLSLVGADGRLYLNSRYNLEGHGSSTRVALPLLASGVYLFSSGEMNGNQKLVVINR